MNQVAATVVIDVSYPDEPDSISENLREHIRSRHAKNVPQLLRIPVTYDSFSRVQVTPITYQNGHAEFQIVVDVDADSWTQARAIARNAVVAILGKGNHAPYQINGIQLTPR